jgi:ribosomal protein S18 acetylase RimI-like enzyme
MVSTDRSLAASPRPRGTLGTAAVTRTAALANRETVCLRGAAPPSRAGHGHAGQHPERSSRGETVDVTRVILRPVRPDEWAGWCAQQIEGYIRQMVDLGGWSPADARAKAADDHARLLPDGIATAGHRFLVAELGDRPVGWLWLGTDRVDPTAVWVYDIEVVPDSRRQGVGRQIMTAAEEQVTTMGGTTIMLNVFAGNQVAIDLYDALGFTTVETRPSGQNMAKVLA